MTMQQEAIISRITYDNHGNNGKLLQDVEYSRWKSFAMNLTADLGLLDM